MPHRPTRPDGANLFGGGPAKSKLHRLIKSTFDCTSSLATWVAQSRRPFYHNIIMSTYFRRRIKMSPACQLEMTLPGGFRGYQG
jgi:hypothetical protein